MTTEEYIKQIKEKPYLVAGSEANICMHHAADEARRITFEINQNYHTQDELRVLFSQLIGKTVDAGFCLFPPFYTDFGKNITLGNGVFINEGCCFQDQAGIIIGDNCLIGHQVVFATLNHDIDPKKRANMFPAPIRLGKNVWIGAHATILPGVTIGDNCVIGAGAVVNKNVPPDCIAAGVPAKIIKKIQGEEI